MSESQVRSLARRLASLEKWRLQSKQPNLGFSTIEAGALQTTDEDGVVRQVLGQQDDGTYTIVDVNGPPPPTPLSPSVQTQPGILTVSSYGLTVADAPWPRDFHRIDAHVSLVPDFEPTIATRITQFSIEGGSVSLALDAGTYYAKLVAVSTSGTKSSASGEASATVTAPEVGAGGAAIYRTSEPPVGLGVGDEATWYDTDNGNLQNYWDGDSWVPVPLGPGATTSDILAGKQVPLDTNVELQWGVPDPSDAPMSGSNYPALKPLWAPEVPAGTGTSYVGLVLDGSSYVQIQIVTDQSTGLKFHRPMLIDSTTGAVTYGPMLGYVNQTFDNAGTTQTRTAEVQGVTKLGTTWYLLIDPANIDGSLGEIVRYDSSWNFVSATTIGTAGGFFNPYSGLSNDGTNLITMSDSDIFSPSSGATIIEKRSPSTGSITSSITATGLSDLMPVDILPLANYDFGASRYVVLANTGGFGMNMRLATLNSTGVEQASERCELLPVGLYSSAIQGIRWNGTTSRFEIAFNGAIYQTSPDKTDRANVWMGYTLYDSLADPSTHESALSPVSASPITIPKRHGLLFTGSIPAVDDDQAPDMIRPYARIGDATQPSKANMDLQSGVVVNEYGNQVYVEQPVNGGAAPPTVSSFPEAPSGELVSETGGLILRGDGTGEWPHFWNRIVSYITSAFAEKDHTHPTLEGRISTEVSDRSAAVAAEASARATAVTNETNARVAGDNALDARLDTIEAGGGITHASATVNIPAGNTYTGGFTFTKIGNLVFANGYIDRATGFNASSHEVVGLVIPAAYRPAAQVVAPSFVAWNTTNTYRYRFNTDGTVFIQQSAAIGVFQAISISWSV